MLRKQGEVFILLGEMFHKKHGISVQFLQPAQVSLSVRVGSTSSLYIKKLHVYLFFHIFYLFIYLFWNRGGGDRKFTLKIRFICIYTSNSTTVFSQIHMP